MSKKKNIYDGLKLNKDIYFEEDAKHYNEMLNKKRDKWNKPHKVSK